MGSALLSAVACAVTRRAGVARIARAWGIVVAVVGAVGIALGIAQTLLAMETPGLSQASEQRMFSNAVAESLDHAAIISAASAMPFLLGWWVLRKQIRVARSMVRVASRN